MIKKLINNFFKDKNGNIVLGQKPNWQILAAIVFYLFYRLINSVTVSDLFYSLFITFLTFWAYEELVRGVNHFRKLLGLGIIILIINLLMGKF